MRNTSQSLGSGRQFLESPESCSTSVDSPDDPSFDSPDDSTDPLSNQSGPPSKKRRLGAESKKDAGNPASTPTRSSRRKQAADWSSMTKTSPMVWSNNSEIYLPIHTAFLPRHPSSLLSLLRVARLTTCSRNP